MSLSVNKYSLWLTSFLSRRGMKLPDQRGFYEYHCSYEEYRKKTFRLKCLPTR